MSDVWSCGKGGGIKYCRRLVWWGSFNAMMRWLLFIWGDYFMCILSVEKLSGEL